MQCVTSISTGDRGFPLTQTFHELRNDDCTCSLPVQRSLALDPAHGKRAIANLLSTQLLARELSPNLKLHVWQWRAGLTDQQRHLLVTPMASKLCPHCSDEELSDLVVSRRHSPSDLDVELRVGGN